MKLNEAEARFICEKFGTLRVLLDARQKHVDILDRTLRGIEECDACIDDEVQELSAFLMKVDDDED